MRVMRDYRTCVGISLFVMQKLREKLYIHSAEQRYSVIYNGLHESESVNVRDLYFEAYEMEWLDSHWEALTDLLKQKGYTKTEQQDISLFFAQYFSSFLEEVDSACPIAKASMRELLVEKKKAIGQMIMYADKWEEQNNQLKVDLKKHKEHFRRLIENTRQQ